jgi:hypothetical protein
MGNFAEGWRETAAPPDAVWDVLADVDHWPQNFTPHLKAAHLDGPLAVAASGWVQTTMPLPRSRFTVTSVDAGRSWAWRGRLLWLTMDYDHRIEPTASGCRVTFDVDLDGPLAFVARGIGRPVYRRQIERALDLLVLVAERRS